MLCVMFKICNIWPGPSCGTTDCSCCVMSCQSNISLTHLYSLPPVRHYTTVSGFCNKGSWQGGVVNPMPTPNLKGQELSLSGLPPPDLFILVESASSLRPCQHSSWDLRDTQAPTPWQGNIPGRSLTVHAIICDFFI